MSAEVLSRLSAAGLHLEVSGDTLTASPRSALTDEARELIRAHKAGLVALLSTPRHEWRVTLPTGECFTSSCSPPCTLVEMRGRYPDARIEPEPDASIEEVAA